MQSGVEPPHSIGNEDSCGASEIIRSCARGIAWANVADRIHFAQNAKWSREVGATREAKKGADRIVCATGATNEAASGVGGGCGCGVEFGA